MYTHRKIWRSQFATGVGSRADKHRNTPRPPTPRGGTAGNGDAPFTAVLEGLDYQHWDETENPAYRLFLGPSTASLPALA